MGISIMFHIDDADSDVMQLVMNEAEDFFYYNDDVDLVELDFKDVEWFKVTTVIHIMTIHQMAKDRGGRVVLKNVGDSAMKVLKTCKADKRLEIIK